MLLTYSIRILTLVGTICSSSITVMAAGEEKRGTESPPRLASNEIAGVYAIIQGRPFHDSIYGRQITGLSIRAYWKDIEPSRGQYRWELFDTVVRRAAGTGKKVRLSVMVGHGVPKWVGAKWFRGSPDSIYDTANKEMPVPWDENLRREQKRMIRTFAERYRGVPHLAFFHIAGPSSIWEELALPKNIVDQPGFSKEVIFECWKEVIDQWATVRGNKRLSVAASAATPVYPNLGEALGRYAAGSPANPLDRGLIGSDFCLQWNYLDKQFEKAVRSQSAKWLPKTAIAWQFWGSTAWPKRKTTDYEGSLRLAVDAGATYVEVYDDDLRQPELAKIAERIDAEMKRLGPVGDPAANRANRGGADPVVQPDRPAGGLRQTRGQCDGHRLRRIGVMPVRLQQAEIDAVMPRDRCVNFD